MPDLGQTFTFEDRSESGADYEILLKSLGEVFTNSIQDGRQEHVKSIEITIGTLRKFLVSMKTGGLVEPDVEDLLDKLNADNMSSDTASLFLLDFTPDNVFIYDGKVQFIDPWEQETYIGSTVPTLAQFQTLSRFVYELPGSKKSDPLFEEMFKIMGAKLGLTKNQLIQQRLLGVALQFSLSSFTRLNSDPDSARIYSQKCLQAISDLNALNEENP